MSLNPSSPPLLDALPPLHKGKACSNCRRRKMRCDAAKPVCGPCSRSTGAFSDCEYTDFGLTKTQQLEDQIAVLEARIEQLQTSGEGSVTLHSPYRGQRVPATQAPNDFGTGIVHLIADRLLEELHPNLHFTLINNFLPHAEELGFFLDTDRFVRIVLDDRGRYEKPIPALLNAVYLAGAHFATPAYPPDTLTAFIRRALQTVSTGLQGNHSQKVIQTIQAEALVAQFLFGNGRLLEGRYHVTAAISLVLSAKLNKITGGGRMPSVGFSGSAGVGRGAGAVSGEIIPVPRDAVEEGERIHAFWTVLWLNNLWTAIDGLPSNVAYTTDDARVDTPWPLEFGDYKQNTAPSATSGRTVQSFLMNGQDDAQSAKALCSKAAVLFEQATQIGRQYRNDPSSARLQRYFLSLDSLIQRFIGNIPTISQATLWAPLSTQLCIHTLARVALIRLYSPFFDRDITSFTRVMNASRSVVEVIRGVDMSRIQYVDPIIPMLWAATCQVFMNGIKKSRVADMSSSPVPPAGMHSLCKEMMNVMEHVVSVCPLMRTQVREVKSALDAIA